jgi:flavin-dependent dehydrogenase
VPTGGRFADPNCYRRIMNLETDVAIVGARVAGSVTAILLGRAGYRVALIDSTTFPSDTISTHFFRGAGLVSVLERLGLLDDVLALGSPRLTSQYSFRSDQTAPSVEGPQDPGEAGFCLSVRRRQLDQILVSLARSTPGVEMWEATTARSLLRDGDRVTGLAVDRDGVSHALAARLVVGADGRGSSVARWVDAAEERRETAARAMYYRYVRGFRGPGGSWDGPVFSFQGDELAYAFPSDDDVTCIALSINLAAFAAFRGAAEFRFSERLSRHPGLAAAFQSSTVEGRLLGSGPKDAVARRPFGPGWALVGDAGLSQDPWTGLGMDNAGSHAVFLAEAIDDWLSERSTESHAFGAYGSRRDQHAMSGFNETAEYGRDLSVLG